MPRHICFIVGVVAVTVALAARPAEAADDIEGKRGPAPPATARMVCPPAPALLSSGDNSRIIFSRACTTTTAVRGTIRLCRRSPRALASLSAPDGGLFRRQDVADQDQSRCRGCGRWMTNCRACHGENYEGGAPAPRLAGQSYDYLLASMNSFANDERTNNLDMPGFYEGADRKPARRHRALSRGPLA